MPMARTHGRPAPMIDASADQRRVARELGIPHIIGMPVGEAHRRILERFDELRDERNVLRETLQDIADGDPTPRATARRILNPEPLYDDGSLGSMILESRDGLIGPREAPRYMRRGRARRS